MTTPTDPPSEPNPGADDQRPLWQRMAAGFAVAFAILLFMDLLGADSPEVAEELSINELYEQVDDGNVETATINDDTRTVTVELTDDTEATTNFPLGYAEPLTDRLLDADVPVEVKDLDTGPPFLIDMLLRSLPILLIVGLLLWMLRGRGSPLSFSGGRGEALESTPAVAFDDVAGIDETVDELKEVVEFLEDPTRFQGTGAKVPHGVLLYGPPGTGKTLLAKAVAGEAGVPFFNLSGSDFVEAYVGVGASRVRKLFDKARDAGKAIVFIDELDAVGKKRTGGGPGGHANEERENTLNQLLVELDGFSNDPGEPQIVVVGATNRVDTLDDALTRPGRFDRQIPVPAPDRRGRQHIMQLHAAGKPVDDDVNFELLARRTPGATGAELANIVNQAALTAARHQADMITNDHFNEALATVMLGRERKSAEVLDLDRKVTAYHEAGHAICALVHPYGEDPVQVSIVPRGPAGGVTWMGGSDHQFMSAPQAKAKLAATMGGRAAELQMFGDEYTQGAAGDMRSATALATKMAAEYGMSDQVGPVYVAEEHRRIGTMSELVHAAVRNLITDALDEANQLLADHHQLLEAVACELLEHENLDLPDLQRIRTQVQDGIWQPPVTPNEDPAADPDIVDAALGNPNGTSENAGESGAGEVADAA